MNDYTFTNTLIKAYFEGSDEYIPSGELIYLHTHPLVKPNFLIELEEMILECGAIIKKHNMMGYPVTKLESLAIGIGQQLPDVTYDNATTLLSLLRETYQHCKAIKYEITKPQ